MHVTDTPITALVLAGSRGDDEPVASAEGVIHKALVRIGGVTMLEHVLGALREAGVARLCVSTSVPAVAEIALRAGAEVIASEPGPSESVARALETTGAPLLVTTADHPLLAPDWVRDFISASPEEADVSVMLARREDVEAAVPGSKRTWLRFADGGWSGCNLFLLTTPDARRAVDQWRMVERERKRPWRIAAQLGWGTLLDYALGRLTMADAIGRVGARMGVKAALVPATDGTAAVDVDSPADLLMVRRIFAGAPINIPAQTMESSRWVRTAKAFFPFFEGARVASIVPAEARPETSFDASAELGRGSADVQAAGV